MSLFSSLKKSSKNSTLIPESIYDFEVKTITGETVKLEQFKGKKLLIVNVASKCGLTPQYTDLQNLHEKYQGQVHILGFPANNFLWQEPGSDEQIAEFCEVNFGVTFPLFSKISVKGKDQHPLYQWLNEKTGHQPDWNFAKYLVETDGKTVQFFKAKTEPLDAELVGKIEN